MNNRLSPDPPTMEDLLHRYRDKITSIGSRHERLHTLRHLLAHTGPASPKYAVEGVWAHRKLLAVGQAAEELYFAPDFIYSAEALDLLASCLERVTAAYVLSAKVFTKLSERDNPDGFLSTGTLLLHDSHSLSLALPEGAVVMVLDGLETPGNAGTILRSCDGAGVDAVLFCRTRTRLTHPKLIKASMGAVFTLPLAVFDNPEDCAGWLEERGFTIFLADANADTWVYAEGETEGQGEGDLGNTALVVGNERYGLRQSWYGAAVRTVAIPMRGFGDSLNVGVAASILAYSFCHKKRCSRSKRSNGK